MARNVSTTGGVLAKKVLNGATGFGVSGGASGSEIDIGETLRVDFGQPRTVIAIKVLFLFNGPEFDDKAEKASVTADGTTYTLSVRRNADDARPTGLVRGTVTKCGATTSSGTGCFLITDPFPGAVSTARVHGRRRRPAIQRQRHERLGLRARLHRRRGPDRSSSCRNAPARRAARSRPSTATSASASTRCRWRIRAGPPRRS